MEFESDSNEESKEQGTSGSSSKVDSPKKKSKVSAVPVRKRRVVKEVDFTSDPE